MSAWVKSGLMHRSNSPNLSNDRAGVIRNNPESGPAAASCAVI